MLNAFVSVLFCIVFFFTNKITFKQMFNFLDLAIFGNYIPYPRRANLILSYLHTKFDFNMVLF